jgi:hypothetical protein
MTFASDFTTRSPTTIVECLEPFALHLNPDYAPVLPADLTTLKRIDLDSTPGNGGGAGDSPGA